MVGFSVASLPCHEFGDIWASRERGSGMWTAEKREGRGADSRRTENTHTHGKTQERRERKRGGRQRVIEREREERWREERGGMGYSGEWRN